MEYILALATTMLLALGTPGSLEPAGTSWGGVPVVVSAANRAAR